MVPRKQGLLLALALNSVGRCILRRDVVGEGHGGSEWVSTPVQNTIVSFLDAVLRPTAVAPTL